MNTASRLKKLVLSMSVGLFFVASASYAAQYTYTPTDLKVTFTTSAGQQDSLSFQQGGQLQAATGNSNAFSGGFNTADAYGLTYADLTDTASTTLTSTSTGSVLEQLSSNANGYYLLNGLLSLANYNDALSVQLGANYGVTDSVSATVTGNGVSIPTGTYGAGTKFSVSAPVSVKVGSATENDVFTGKMVLGELRPIKDSWGNLTGTRLIEVRVTGTLTDSAGDTYKIDQVYGQNDLSGVTPDQVSLNYSFVQQ